MTRFGPAREVACPSCGARASEPTLRSTTASGGVRWSDGWVATSPQPPLLDPLTRCGACAAFVWRDELVEPATPGAAPAPELPRRLAPEALRAALDRRAFRNADEERALRLLLWWRASEPLRGASPALEASLVLAPVLAAVASTVVIGPADPRLWVLPAALVLLAVLALRTALAEQRARRRAAAALREPGLVAEVEALLPLLREDPPEERLIRADLLRQLGRPDEALRLLDGSQERPGLERWAGAIRRAARRGDRRPRAV